MIPIFVAAGFIFLAAFFNSVMDATENEPNFNESILKNLNRNFWLKTVSWQYAKKIFGYKFDAWHLSKTCMVFSIAGAIIAAIFAGASGVVSFINWFGVVQIFAIIGAVWNGSFKLFYHLIFKVK